MLADFKVEFCGRVFECVDKGFGQGCPVDVVIRPEDLRIGFPGDSRCGAWSNPLCSRACTTK